MGLLKQKPLIEFEIQQFTGPQYGWECVDCSDSFSGAKQALKDYQENQPEFMVRIKRVRVSQ